MLNRIRALTRRLAVLGLLSCLTFTPAMAAPVVFVTDLSGPAEAPPNASPGTGWAQVFFDHVAHSMRVLAHFEGLLGSVTASHIHCCTADPDTGTAGVATPTPTFPGFPSNVTSGDYDRTFDMTLTGSYRAGFVTANGGTAASAEAALFQGLQDGKAYLNVHTNLFPGGEIRGFLHVPEPTSLALTLGALGLLGLRRRIAA